MVEYTVCFDYMGGMRVKVLSVFGTRPEAIKMAPLLKKLEAIDAFKSVVCVTAQHRQMLDQVLRRFHIQPDYDLNLMRTGQTLPVITTHIVNGLTDIIGKEKPHIVLVHGDTTTSMVAALTAFYQRVPVGHVEAGLRSFHRYSPFPEEINRTLTSRLATLHFAPTETNRENLKREGITENVFVVGNTVIDALAQMTRSGFTFRDKHLRALDFTQGRWILVTAHRRENIGEPLERICRAVRRIVTTYPDVQVVFPVHLNPAVREKIFASLEGCERILLMEPVEVEDMYSLIKRVHMVLTDSGGIQEEASTLGTPVVILRSRTERPEAVEAGKAILAGSDEEKVFTEASYLLENEQAHARMSEPIPLYGDGMASDRIADILLSYAREKGLPDKKARP